VFECISNLVADVKYCKRSQLQIAATFYKEREFTCFDCWKIFTHILGSEAISFKEHRVLYSTCAHKK